MSTDSTSITCGDCGKKNLPGSTRCDDCGLTWGLTRDSNDCQSTSGEAPVAALRGAVDPCEGKQGLGASPADTVGGSQEPSASTDVATAACPHCDEDGLCSVCDEDTQDPGPLTPQRSGVSPGPEGAPAAPALDEVCGKSGTEFGPDVLCTDRKGHDRWSHRGVLPDGRYCAWAIGPVRDVLEDVEVARAERDAQKARVAELEAEAVRVAHFNDLAWAEGKRILEAEKAAAVRDFKADLSGNAALRARFGARGNETMPMFHERLVAERDAAIAEKAAAVLAERERCLDWICRRWRLGGLTDGIRSGEAAPK